MKTIKSDERDGADQTMGRRYWNAQFAGKKYGESGGQFHAETTEKHFNKVLSPFAKLLINLHGNREGDGRNRR